MKYLVRADRPGWADYTTHDDLGAAMAAALSIPCPMCGSRHNFGDLPASATIVVAPPVSSGVLSDDVAYVNAVHPGVCYGRLVDRMDATHADVYGTPMFPPVGPS